jgi:TetR/AcrR family transcriptional repressor of nem operon
VAFIFDRTLRAGRCLPCREDTTAAKRRSALAAWATLVGALILARAVDDPDLSDEMLHAVSASLSAR